MFDDTSERFATLTVGSQQTRILLVYVQSEHETRWYLPSGPNVPRDCPTCRQDIRFCVFDPSGQSLRCSCGATFPVSSLA